MSPPPADGGIPHRRAEQPVTWTGTDGRTLRGSYLPSRGKTTGQTLVVFLPGYRSVCTGTKATAVATWCAGAGHACLRFDHLCHGASDGHFADFRVSTAIADAAAWIQSLAHRHPHLILVGSSMGGWIALELVRQGHLLPAGLLLIAPAPGFVRRSLAALPAAQRAVLDRDDEVLIDDPYAPGTRYPVTRAFLDDALGLEAPYGTADTLPITCPTMILQGTHDDAVPLAATRALAHQLANVELIEVAHGDHRLTDHLPTITAALAKLVDGN